MYIPYNLKFSRIKYFVVWLNSVQKQIFADKIFVVERESRKVHTYMYVYNKYQIFHGIKFSWSIYNLRKPRKFSTLKILGYTVFHVHFL